MEKWYGIPKLKGSEVSIIVGNETGKGYSKLTLTLKEAEDLEWRIKQSIQLLKHGKISKQRA
jgi:hypothetical protein